MVVGSVEYERVDTDTGVVQIDSLRLDEEATVREANAFMRTFEDRVQREAALLEASRASLVVSDIPPLGIAAGKRAGLPVAALGNFTWDWIYAAYHGAGPVAEQIGHAYALADVALRLPMHGGFASFSNIVDLPFVARRSTRERAETRRAIGVPEHERVVLTSFGGYGVAGMDLASFAALDGYCVLMSGNTPDPHPPVGSHSERRRQIFSLDERAMYAAGFRYEDVVRAVDVVVSKPGYGIISECLANDTALLYTSRGHFAEYDVLVRELPRYVRCGFIDHDALFAGTWAPALDALLRQPDPPERPAVNGADLAAEHLLTVLR
jgi:hypothetical protein